LLTSRFREKAARLASRPVRGQVPWPWPFSTASMMRSVEGDAERLLCGVESLDIVICAWELVLTASSRPEDQAGIGDRNHYQW
jgi:hypothetical protein